MLLLPIHVMEAMQMVSFPIYDYLTQVFPGLLETLTSCREEIESCGSPLTDSSSQGQEILDKITGCKAAAENFITGSPLFFQEVPLTVFFPELKNCSKKEPGFERCQCLQAMDESNVEIVKVKKSPLCMSPNNAMDDTCTF